VVFCFQLSPLNGERSRSPRKNGPEKSSKREGGSPKRSDMSSRGSNSSRHKDVSCDRNVISKFYIRLTPF